MFGVLPRCVRGGGEIGRSRISANAQFFEAGAHYLRQVE